MPTPWMQPTGLPAHDLDRCARGSGHLIGQRCPAPPQHSGPALARVVRVGRVARVSRVARVARAPMSRAGGASSGGVLDRRSVRLRSSLTHRGGATVRARARPASERWRGGQASGSPAAREPDRGLSLALLRAARPRVRAWRPGSVGASTASALCGPSLLECEHPEPSGQADPWPHPLPSVTCVRAATSAYGHNGAATRAKKCCEEPSGIARDAHRAAVNRAGFAAVRAGSRGGRRWCLGARWRRAGGADWILVR